MVGNTRININSSYIEFVYRLKIGIYITATDVTPRYSFFIGSVNYFIINIRKILHMGYFITFMLQKAVNNIPGDKRTCIADMRMIVRGYTANIDAGFTWHNRHKFFFLLGQSIINFYAHLGFLLYARVTPAFSRLPLMRFKVRSRPSRGIISVNSGPC
ncbi:hypothetical protein SDC9_99618 [bioreactor metagenome]|uniref:Uncharacterized protein n=1 Tax=bioreactor metagenome TaxID=1076179 RepID=A0A645ATG5_9ZZZZ